MEFPVNNLICRVCLEDSLNNSVPLFVEYERKSLAELIEYCTSIKVSLEDSYPQNVCDRCFHELKVAYRFKKKCSDADIKLKELAISTSTIKLEDENSISSIQIHSMSNDLEFNNTTFPAEPKIELNENDVKMECFDIPMESMMKAIVNDENDESSSRESRQEFTKKYKHKSTKSIDKYPCTICKKTMKRKSVFYQHLKEHEQNGDDPLDECKSCNKKFYFPDSYLKHKCPIKSICYLCNIEFNVRTELYKHIAKVHIKAGTYTCEQTGCQSVLASAEGVFFHLITHFNPIIEICSFCGRVFKDPRTFSRHGKLHKSRIQYTCDLCGIKIWSKSNFHRHMKTSHLNKKYFCDLCDASFSETLSLKLHKIKVHNADPPFRCDTCNNGFVYLSQLKLHQKGHLTGKQFRTPRDPNEVIDHGKRAWECSTCLKTFTMKANYKRHMKTVHLQIRQFSCNLCEKTFTQKSVLDTHLRIHTGEKPFGCQYCTARYSDRSTLYKHLKNIHKEEKPATKNVR